MDNFKMFSINWGGGGNAVIFTNAVKKDLTQFAAAFFGSYDMEDETIINYFIDNGFL